MPYTTQIYDDDKLKIPNVGDVFVITEMAENMIDIFGECTQIELSEDTELIAELKHLRKENDRLHLYMRKLLEKIKAICKEYLIGDE